jgi:general secretion pathway protein G
MWRELFRELARSNRKTLRAGFSLLEIMVVITIMAMVMGAISVGVMSYLDRAKDKQAAMDIKTISNALDLYKSEFGKYPDSIDALVKEKILKEKKVPKDPWGNEFVYINPGSNNEDGFDLYSLGKDGREGGGDDITNWDDEE